MIRDVCPRDGLQPEQPIDISERVRLIEALVTAGLRKIEAIAFVSPKAVPAMAGAAEVMAQITRHDDVTYAALVPNRRGAEMALEAGVDEFTATVSISETYSRNNVNMSTEESFNAIAEIVSIADEIPIDASISCAFGSPYEGEFAASAVGALGARLLDIGVSNISYADTTGMATPRLIEALIDEVGPDVALHLHETRDTALLNAYTAMRCGVRHFDTSVAGLGGSPFAAGAGGNLATEALVAVCDDAGIETGIDIDRLIDAANLAGGLVGRPIDGVAKVGPRTRLSGTRAL